MRYIGIYIISFCWFFASCGKDVEARIEVPNLSLMESPKGFPEIVHPEDNTYTQERWALGKRLFYDPILSKDGKVSCASCHDAELAFSDNKPQSLGSDGLVGKRNAPTLANVAFHPYYTREGGVPTLEMQVLVPIQEHDEFNNNIVLIAEQLMNDASYRQMSMDAYGQEPNPFVITRALAQFERSIVSGQSAYDMHANYGAEISSAAVRGASLFFSDRLSCASCHTGFNYTNYTFQNNGLYLEYLDNGRERLTQQTADRAMFKVPTLRNIELTSPYMHDGSMNTLEEVIDHYDSGGKDHLNKSKLVRPLFLSQDEKKDLIAFLYSLTDERFINNPYLRNE